jgi:RimJ/RimL family protein N-acetyltransferase
VVNAEVRSDPVVLETPRLVVRRMTAPDDVGFVLRLLNDRGFLEHIGDKGVRTDEDAERYIAEGPRASYQRFGYGLYTVVSKASGTALGICGLVKRESLDDVDIGYAFLPESRGQGYALEAATAVMDYARDTVGLHRVVALTNPRNDRSIRLLEKLGLRLQRTIVLAGETRVTLLFGPAKP